MTPDLKSIKAAAEAILATVTKDVTPHGIEYNNDVENQRYGLMEPYELSTFALAQIAALDEQGDGEAVTAEWLQENWSDTTGFAEHEKRWLKYRAVFSIGRRQIYACVAIDNYVSISMHTISGANLEILSGLEVTRQQFIRLMSALGIQRKDGK